MNQIIKTFRYPLNLTKSQKNLLFQWASAGRYLWNKSLQLKSGLYKRYKIKIGYFGRVYPNGTKNKNGLNKRLTTLRNRYEWLGNCPNAPQQMILQDLDKAFKNFFSRIKKGQEPGYPKFKGRWKLPRLFFPKQQVSLIVDEEKRAYIKIPRIKFPLRIVYDRPALNHKEDFLSSISIIKDQGKWFINLLINTVEDKLLKPTGEMIGLDMGITKTYALSNGLMIKIDDKMIKILEGRKAHLQKFLSKKIGSKKKEKKSKKWLDLKSQIQRIDWKISNIRKNFNHTTSKNLVRSYPGIVIEDLKIKNMTKSAAGTKEQPGKNVGAKSGLNRAILRNGWSQFGTMLDYKSKKYDVSIIRVPPQYTSQSCPKCGYVDKENRHGSKFECLKCGHMDDADVNGAINILNKSLEGSPGRALGSCDNSRTL